MPVTNEQINNLQENIDKDFRDCRTEEVNLSNDKQILESIKYQKREIEKEVTRKDFRTGEKTKSTITETVYDVSPKSRDDPTVDMPEKTRTKIFNNINKKRK